MAVAPKPTRIVRLVSGRSRAKDKGQAAAEESPLLARGKTKALDYKCVPVAADLRRWGPATKVQW